MDATTDVDSSPATISIQFPFTRKQQQYLKHLIHTGAFGDKTDDSTAPMAEASYRLFLWTYPQINTVRVSSNTSKLKMSALPRNRLAPKGNHEFKHHPPSDEPLYITGDDHPGPLVMRFPRPHDDFTDELEAAVLGLDVQLRPHQAPRSDQHQRGNFRVVHYGIWADSSKEMMITREHREHNRQYHGVVDHILGQGQGVFGYAEWLLQITSPEMYVKLTRIDEHLPEGMSRQMGPWHAMAINMCQTGDASERHYDTKDYHRSYNCVVPFGIFEGGDLILWSIQQQLAVRRGDIVLFLGATIAHSVSAISGIRHSIDCFVHNSNIRWMERKIEAEQGKRSLKAAEQKSKKRKASKGLGTPRAQMKRALEAKKKEGRDAKSARLSNVGR